MKRTAKEGNVSADRFTAGKTTMVWLTTAWKMEAERSSLVAPSLISGWISVFAKYTAACCNRIKCLVIFRVFVQSGCIGLQKRSHLVDERTGTAGTDTVHTLLYIAAFKIDDLGILAAKLDGNICLRCQLLQRSGYGDNLLYKRYFQMVGKCQSAGTGDDRMQGQFAKLYPQLSEKICKGFLNVCKMALIIGKEKLVLSSKIAILTVVEPMSIPRVYFLSVMNQTPFIIRNNLNTLYDKK